MGDVGIDPDEPTVCLDERLGDGQAEPRPATPTVLAEHFEDALTVFPCDAGTVVAHRDLDLRRPAGRASRPVTRMALSGGEMRSAFSSTLARTWLIRT